MINKEDIYESQRKWALGIVNIGKVKNDFTRAQELTQEFLENQYDFNLGNVQFKPTKASLHQFRNDISSATSYFIGGNKSFEEDSGFAFMPWSEVKFENDSILIPNNENFSTTSNYLITNSRLEMEGFSKHNKSEVFNVSSGSMKLWTIYTLD